MKRLIIKPALAMVCGILLMAAPALAGWVQTDANGSKMLIQDGKIKETPQEAGPLWTVLDFQKGTILAVNKANKTYAVDTLDAFCRAMSQMVARFRKMSGAQKGQAPVVKIVDKGAGPKIAGYSTRKYEIFLNGSLREELWLTTAAPFLKDFDKKMVARAMACGADGQDLESSPAYRKLAASGWAMRTIAHEGGEREVETDVTTIQKQAIPAKEFAIPAGYKKTTLPEVLASAS